MIKKLLFTFAAVLILIGIAGMAVNNFKFGEDLVTYEKRWELKDTEALKQLRLSSGFATEIAFETSSDNTSSISFEGTIKQEHADILNAFDPAGSEIDLDLTTPPAIEFLGVNFRFPKGKLTVSLPAGKELEALMVSSLSNNIRLNGASSKRIDISLTSGDIVLNQVNAEQLTIENKSGDIKGTGIQAATSIKNRSGNIRLKDLEGPAEVNLISGDINLGLLGSSPVRIMCKSGDIDVRPDASFRGVYELTTHSGSVDAPDSPGETNDTIHVETHSGDIRILR